MPVRRRVAATTRQDVDPVSVFRWSLNGSGLDHLLGDPCYRTERDAFRGWQKARRPVWAAEARFRVPAPARHYDGLTVKGLDHMQRVWNHRGPFDLDGTLERLAEDRDNLARFRATPAARTIRDYLAVFADDLAAVERVAHELAAVAAGEHRSYPGHRLSTATTYSQTDLREDTSNGHGSTSDDDTADDE